jgi:hypothetical protein
MTRDAATAAAQATAVADALAEALQAAQQAAETAAARGRQPPPRGLVQHCPAATRRAARENFRRWTREPGRCR